MRFALGLLLAAIVAVSSAEMCTNPVVKNTQVYSSSDSALSSETAIILQFGLTCNGKATTDFLTATVAGKKYAVAKTDAGYQVYL